MESTFDLWLNAWWGPALAFAAGVVSFASPCVLPLVPGYLSFVSGGQGASASRAPAPATVVSAPGDGGSAPTPGGGVAVETKRGVAPARTGGADGGRATGAPVLPMFLFVLGFAAVFTALGAFTQTFLPIFRSEWGIRISGAIVLAFGVLMLMYALRVGGAWLFAERRPFLSKVRPGGATAFPLGMAFAAGWTPCIGPVLAGILGLAAAQGGGAWGAILMFSYSLGLGLPFILLGFGMNRLLGVMKFMTRNYHWFGGVAGVVMLFIGTLMALNLWQRFLADTGLLQLVNRFSPPI